MALLTLPDLSSLPDAPPIPAAAGTDFQDAANQALAPLDTLRSDLAGGLSDLTAFAAGEGQQADKLGSDLAAGQEVFNSLAADVKAVDFSREIAAAQAADAAAAAGADEAAHLPGPLSYSDDLPDLGTPNPPPTSAPLLAFASTPAPSPAPAAQSAPLPEPSPAPCPHGWVLDLNGDCIPPILANPCGSEFEVDPISGQCQPIGSSVPICPEGFELDPISGQCGPSTFGFFTQHCPQGYAPDPITGKCAILSPLLGLG